MSEIQVHHCMTQGRIQSVRLGKGAISSIFGGQVPYYRESCFQNCIKLWWINLLS